MMKYPTLLCSVNPSVPPANIDEYTFYKIFSKYAPVKNIKVFIKSGQVKSFIQVENDDAVDTVIEHLHQKHLDIGKLKVFPSHKKFIAFDKSIKDIIESRTDGLQTKTKPPENIRAEIVAPLNHYMLNALIEKHAKQANLNNHGKAKFYTQQLNAESRHKQTNMNPRINDYKTSEDIKKQGKANLELKNSDNMHKSKEINYEHHQNPSKSKKVVTKFLRVENIDLISVSGQMLLNLFGCYGNVIRIGLFYTLKCTIIEIETEEQAQSIVKYLNDIYIFGNIMTITYIEDASMLDEAEREPSKEVKLLMGYYKYFRYKTSLKIRENKPSKLLHFTCVAPNITSEALHEIISQVHEPTNILQLGKKGSDSNMYIISFKQLYQSLEVLSVLHNKRIEGRLLKVSFSHTMIYDSK